ncbi:hypothetical protein Asulf_01356 [Archaeoglobus sulfaticallidus PM70-1]|uniref:MrfA-like Zn-binding domain-containing protein n=1 Tax=Archaeoglobus sulfaticallidus PM70-1 TaxID=387631 RepID=N0BGC2_9EURY|nr:DUF1998 domain-containing protein [Archaeoglobus sulfaticallidus]AGK61347.1 hypothetical protein Asulf_01356 [Archaeoglobus sulfaticallidus PM70-1]
MAREIQHIRRSQFVLTYGPGALIESKNGPRMIPSIEHGLGSRFKLQTFERYEITDSRLRIVIKNLTGKNARVFSLPTNAGEGRPNTEGIYHTYVFPTWKICYGREGGHPNDTPVLHNSERCPVCGRKDDSSAVRFVAACINGHLDEVDWDYAVHRGRTCKPRYYLWRAEGSSLSDLVVECHDCGKKTTMKEIYNIKFRCSGRRPETEHPRHSSSGPSVTEPKRPFDCERPMRVLQRQSTSLRLPVTVTLLTIPEYDGTLPNILQKTSVAASIRAILNSPWRPCEGGVEKEKIVQWIRDALVSNGIPEESISEIEKYVETNGISKFCELFEQLHSEDRSFLDFMYEELESLLSGPRTTQNFSMGPPEEIRSDQAEIIPDMKVYPVDILRTVTAQTGFYRVPYLPENGETAPAQVSSGVYLDGALWYPGFEGQGEGVFITFAGDPPDLSTCTAFDEWKNSRTETDFVQTMWGDAVHEPLFVWLHTLSHALILTLSLHAGYSSASLRERVYINRDATSGGILIYTTSPGEDGSMGGLTGSLKVFREILRKSSERLKLCSNDPLCLEVRKTPERVNGSACHSCLLISETSCEHRNMWLDRHIILGD